MRISVMLTAMVAVCALLFTQGALAQGPDAGAVSTVESNISYLDFFVVKGGWIAYFLIILSVITIALTIEHSFSIRRATIVPAVALQETQSLLQDRKYVEAINYTAEEPSMLGHALHASLLEAGNGFDAMERALEETLEDRAARLFRKTEYVHIIGNVAPMIGLLGTVTGMILLFAEIHASDAFLEPRVVADRIAVALITTFWGLAVSIPALSIFAVFRNRIDVLTAECALAAERLLNEFKPGRRNPVVAGVGHADLGVTDEVQSETAAN
ncbi:MAG: MotA/TolQ/ExbB proton channel family protein [Phycisphaerae bacterium]